MPADIASSTATGSGTGGASEGPATADPLLGPSGPAPRCSAGSKRRRDGSVVEGPQTPQLEHPEEAQEASTSTAARVAAGCDDADGDNVVEWSLGVKFSSASGRCRYSHLMLKPLESVDALVGLPRELMSRGFPGESLPAYLSSGDYYHFTPEDECLSLPGDVARTDFRLVAHHQGWERVVHERPLVQPQEATCNFKVTTVEFESGALFIGTIGIRVNLVAYPVVSILKTFLQETERRLQSDPDFKGIAL